MHQIEQNDVLPTKGAWNQGNRAPKEEIDQERWSNVLLQPVRTSKKQDTSKKLKTPKRSKSAPSTTISNKMRQCNQTLTQDT